MHRPRLGFLGLLLALAAVGLSQARTAHAVGCLVRGDSLIRGTLPLGALAVGDVNEDGILDLVVADSTGMRIALGNGAGGVGNGTFAIQPAIASSGNARYALFADLNGDGILDLASVHNSNHTLRVFRGQGAGGVGDGTFLSLSSIAVGTNPAALALGDFNDDGILDAAVANTNLASVGVLIGLGSGGIGNGTFGAMTSYAVGSAPVRVTTADFDNDGMLDLAVTNNSGVSRNISVLRGQGSNGLGNGSFIAGTPLPMGANPWGITAADVNEDGAMDVLATDVTRDSLYTFLGNGDLTFDPAIRTFAGDGPRDVLVTELNGDGIVDVVLTAFNTSELVALHGGGAGGVGDGTYPTRIAYASAFRPEMLVCGDFVEDGIVDVVVTHVSSRQVVTFSGLCAIGDVAVGITVPDGGESVHPGETMTFSWTRGGNVHAVDLDLTFDNGASWKRIAANLPGTSFDWNVVGPTSNLVRLRVSDPCVESRAATSERFEVCAVVARADSFARASSGLALTSGDVNEDGVLDLVVSDDTGLRVALGNGAGGAGDGTFAPQPAVPASTVALSARLADVNEDGILDLLGTFSPSGDLRVYPGLGTGGVGNGTFGAAASFPTSVNSRELEVADLNEDGILDAVFLNSANPYGVGVKLGGGEEGVGDGTFATMITVPLADLPSALVLADLNEDGILDLAVPQNSFPTRLDIFPGLGSAGVGNGTFGASAVTLACGPSPAGMVSADVDEDGHADLLLADGADSLFVYLGNGDLTFAAPVRTFAGDGVHRLVATELDGDGILDVLLTANNTGELVALLGGGAGGAGDGTYPRRSASPTAFRPEHLVCGDFLEDGRVDVVVSHTSSSQVVTYAGGCAIGGVIVGMVSPAAGAEFEIGDTTTVTWFKASNVHFVDLEISHDAGANWEPLARNLIGTSYAWKVVGPRSIHTRIRVVEPCTGAEHATGAFTICSEFVAAETTAVLNHPRAAARGDLNEDGIEDAVVAYATSNGFSVLLGQGVSGVADGTFARTDYGLSTIAEDVEIGDFDDDGILDVALSRGVRIQIWKGQGAAGVGNGTLAPADSVSIPGPDVSQDIALGDFDEDGTLDVAAAVIGGSNFAALLFNSGADGAATGVLGSPVFLPGFPCRGITSCDFDDDGILDLLLTSQLGNDLYRLRGTGSGGNADGGFTSVGAFLLAGNARRAVTGDFNEDGILDVALPEPGLSQIQILLGDGVGGVGTGLFGLAPTLALPGTQPYDCGVADYDADGIPDLAVALFAPSQLKVASGVDMGGGVGTGTFTVTQTIGGGGGQCLLASDFIGLGAPDVLIPAFFEASVHAFTAGCGTAAAAVAVTNFTGGEIVTIGDEAAIQLTRTATVCAVDVEVSRDGGANWEPVARNTSETTLAWTVTGPTSGQVRLRVVDNAVPSRADTSGTFSIAAPVGVGDGPEIAPLAFTAGPNPFRTGTALHLRAPSDVRATVEIFDIGGRLVRTLHDGALAAGVHRFEWDGRARDGREAAAGVYLARARWEGFEAERRIARLR